MKLYNFVLLSIYIITNFFEIYCCIPCNDNPLEQIYHNQNQCVLLSEIPPELQNLPYGIYPFPNCDSYNTNRFGYNKRFNFFPHAIFMPSVYAEVAYLLSALKKYNLPFAVRSGGHCFGAGSLSDGYIIDLSKFNSIIPNLANSTVFVGAGARLGHIIETLGNLNYAMPTGTCPSVGIAGLALGGGIGYLARQLGLTTDAIVSMNVMLADGNVVEVTATNQYSDLFWALRGAGANAFGIVLGFTFKITYMPAVSFLSLTFNWCPKQIIEVFSNWQEWVKILPTTITGQFDFVYNNGKLKTTITALKVGSEAFDEWKPFFEKFDPIVNLYQGNYIGAANIIAGSPTQPFAKVRTKFIFKPICLTAVNLIINFFNKLKNLGCNYLVTTTFGSAFGGAISQGDSSYFPRSAFEWIFMLINWIDQTQHVAALNLINQLYNELEPYTSVYSYANLIDFELGATYLNAYYGSHVPRLIQIKNKYDPQNIFTWLQGIPLKFIAQSNISYIISQKYCDC